MNLVDAGGWLEFFADGPNAGFFAEALLDPERLLVPAVTIHEVFRIVCRQRGEDVALQAAALMQQGEVVELSASLAMVAARTGLESGLSLADSIVLATARQHDAHLWTQDEHFLGLAEVRYIARNRPADAERRA